MSVFSFLESRHYMTLFWYTCNWSLCVFLISYVTIYIRLLYFTRVYYTISNRINKSPSPSYSYNFFSCSYPRFITFISLNIQFFTQVFTIKIIQINYNTKYCTHKFPNNENIILYLFLLLVKIFIVYCNYNSTSCNW